MNTKTLFALCIASLAVGCGHGNPFADGGYQHAYFPVYVAPTDGRLVSPDWIVDGWVLGPNEQPVHRMWGQTNELALRHRHHDGRIVLDVLPVDLAARDVVLQRIDQQIVSRAYDAHVSHMSSRLELVSSADVAIDGHAAHVVLLQEGAGDGLMRGMFVFVRANYLEEQRRAWRVTPVLIVAGYVNAARDFEAGLPDFQRFLSSIDLGTSVSSQAPVTPPSPETSVPVEAPVVDAPPETPTTAPATAP